MTITSATRMTADQFWEWCTLPENGGRRFELNRGRVVEVASPGCLHGEVCGRVAQILSGHVLSQGRGRVVTDNRTLLVTRSPDTLRRPDILFFDQIDSIEQLGTLFSDEVLRLVVEVRSSDDSFGGMMDRVCQYLAHKVPLVWLVDPLERAVTVFHDKNPPRVLDESDLLTGNGILPDLSIPVAQIFQLPGTSTGEVKS